MPLLIPDEAVQDTGLSEQDLLVEIACRLYDAQKISKPAASKMARLSRPEFESALLERGLPWIRVSDEDGLADIEQAMKFPRGT